MLISILHRATGTAMATGGMLLLLWWLVSIASGPASYEHFYTWVVVGSAAGAEPSTANLVVYVLSRLVGVGLTWTFFQHLGSGLRHFVLDTGAGYELKTNKFWAIMTIVVSIAATVAIWAPILVRI
jgi:succinate dehydrogenase / fumarate reductase cytochrome b subunit